MLLATDNLNESHLPSFKKVMTAAMERGDDVLRLRACDVLLAAGLHDPQPLRAFIEAGDDNRRLLGILITTLGTPNANGLQEQVNRSPTNDTGSLVSTACGFDGSHPPAAGHPDQCAWARTALSGCRSSCVAKPSAPLHGHSGSRTQQRPC